jgi:hypothetical protein
MAKRSKSNPNVGRSMLKIQMFVCHPRFERSMLDAQMFEHSSYAKLTVC